LGTLKKLGIAAAAIVIIVVFFFVLASVTATMFVSEIRDNRPDSSWDNQPTSSSLESETKRVKNLVRNSEHLTEPQKEVILRAIDDTCKNNIGYMQGEKIGDAVLKQCLATYEKKAKGEDKVEKTVREKCWDSVTSVFQYTTDKDVYTSGEDVTITGKYVSPDVTWKHPNGSSITPTREQINFDFTTPTRGYATNVCYNNENTNGWECSGHYNDPLADNDWLSPVEHTLTVSTNEYWVGEVAVEVSWAVMSSNIHESMSCVNSDDQEILRFEIVPVQ